MKKVAKARGRVAAKRTAPAKKRARQAAAARPLRSAPVPNGVAGAAALRAIEERISARGRRIEEAKREFEAAARELRAVVAEQAAKVEPGPRRFRTGPARSREIQRAMADLASEMRILAARRAELQWLQQLLGARP